jgi:hypothetical protein
MASRLRWIAFALAVPFCLYTASLGLIFMGFCSGIGCLPHTFAWILLAPSLILGIWSTRATAVVAAILLIAHIFVEGHLYGAGFGANALWGTDKGLDITLWTAVILLSVAAAIPAKKYP